ncbi:hypothetical protein D915_001622 [Fasciola hepatica]|uniref:Uncharacterized protein n=1 Tax=Fasciola hepatica TaxID=6192 RepID=A0A2H1CRM7_FASHE|nr:hypothetical protein D915_001622 [Fasciola hepatica]
MVFEAQRLTPTLAPGVPFFAVVQFLQIPLAFVRAASTDPGILPRATKPEANRGKYQKLPGDLFVDGLENHRVKRFTTAKCATLSDRSACAQNSDVGSRGQIEFLSRVSVLPSTTGFALFCL